MASDKRLVITAIFIVLVLNLITATASCHAQATAPLPDEYLLGTNGVNSTDVPDSVVIDQPTGATSAVDQASITAPDQSWHFSLSPYLWLPGMHGTVGGLGRDISVHASPGDLLSHFRFGLMGTVEARHKRLLLPLDLIWVRLGDNKALPLPNLMATTANMKGSVFILTPTIGFRLLDEEKSVANTPGRSDGTCSFVAFHQLRPSHEPGRVGSCIVGFGLLSVYLRYGQHARQVAFATLYTRGFSNFVASTAALIATRWSEPVHGRVYLRCGPTPFTATAHPAIRLHRA